MYEHYKPDKENKSRDKRMGQFQHSNLEMIFQSNRHLLYNCSLISEMAALVLASGAGRNEILCISMVIHLF